MSARGDITIRITASSSQHTGPVVTIWAVPWEPDVTLDTIIYTLHSAVIVSRMKTE